MNERIRELAEQAFNFVAKQNMCKKEYFWENIRHNRELQDSVDAKFAELIVKECASRCEDIAIKHQVEETTYAAGKKAGAFECAEDLKQHFGVEE